MNRRRRRGLRWAGRLLALGLLGWLVAGSGWIPGLGGGPLPGWLAVCTGQVVDGRGRPVAGAWVQLGEQKGRTAPDGRFRFASVPAGTVTLTVAAPGYAPHQERLTFTAKGAPEPLRIRLARAITLRGRVRSRDLGVGLLGARVRAVSRDGTELAAETDRAGRFQLGPVAEGERICLRVEHPDYVPAVWAGPARTEPVELFLEVGAVVSGRVEPPRPGVHVLAYRGRVAVQTVEKATLTDLDGTFLLAGLLPGLTVLKAESAAGEPRSRPLTLRLRPGGEVTGVVLALLPERP